MPEKILLPHNWTRQTILFLSSLHTCLRMVKNAHLTAAQVATKEPICITTMKVRETSKLWNSILFFETSPVHPRPWTHEQGQMRFSSFNLTLEGLNCTVYFPRATSTSVTRRSALSDRNTTDNVRDGLYCVALSWEAPREAASGSWL